MLRSTVLDVAILTVATLALSATALAQPSPDRFFRILDRNENGQVDPDEWERFPPLRDYAQSQKIDLSQPLAEDDFTRIGEGWAEQSRTSSAPERPEGEDRDENDRERERNRDGENVWSDNWAASRG